VEERRLLVVDQELVEGDAVRLRHGGDAVDASRDVVDARLHRSLPFVEHKCAAILNDRTPMCNNFIRGTKV
jgi:hypothetical protein